MTGVKLLVEAANLLKDDFRHNHLRERVNKALVEHSRNAVCWGRL
jgi:hypothetical protein